jgi:chromosome segregation ATPase
MQIGHETFTSSVEIEADPRRPMSRADRMARQNALMSLRDLAKPLYDASQAVDRLGEQLLEAEHLLEDHEGAPESITEELSALQEELSEISTTLTEVRRNAGIGGAIQQSSTLPTEDQLWQVDAAWDSAPELIERLNAMITDRMPDFNASLDAEGIRPDPGAVLEVPRRRGRQ